MYSYTRQDITLPKVLCLKSRSKVRTDMPSTISSFSAGKAVSCNDPW